MVYSKYKTLKKACDLGSLPLRCASHFLDWKSDEV